MKPGVFVRAALGAAILALLTANLSFAQRAADFRTYFTFSGPVAIPGVTLPAGKYLFRVADDGNRVVQVLSSDGKKSYAMFFIYRADRSNAPVDPEIQFMETAAGMPQAIRTWWYAGNRTGFEFVYPKEQARLLAKGTGTAVLATAAAPPVTVTPEPAAPVVTKVEPSGIEEPVVVAAAPEPVTEPTLKGEPVPEMTLARADLSLTASSMPLVFLVSLGLLLAAVLVRGVRFTLR